MPQSYSFALATVALVSAIHLPVASAQTHFSGCVSLTGNSAHVLIPAGVTASIDGNAAATGDELAVFTPGGTCAGSVVWGTSSRALTMWGDDRVTPTADSFVDGDAIRFAFWDASTQTEYSDVTVQFLNGESYYETSGLYAEDAVYVLSALSVSADPQAPALSAPVADARAVSLAPTLEWAQVADAESYELQVAENSSFSPTVVDRTGIETNSADVTGLDEGTTYFWRVRAVRAAGPTGYSTSSFTTLSRQTIALSQGWNLVSGRVDPLDRSMEDVFSANESEIVLVKDGAGAMFYPEFSINAIGEWESKSGYMVYARSGHALEISGDGLAPTSPIALDAGWNMVAYLPTAAMSAPTAMATIADEVVLVKNGAGQVWMPEFNVNTIGLLQPGRGYQVHVASPSTLVYAEGAGKTGGAGQYAHASADQADPSGALASNATVLVLLPEHEDGVLVEARSGSLVVGHGTVEDGKAVVVIEGDDDLTPEVIEGARIDEELTLSLSGGASGQTLTASYENLLNGGVEDRLLYGPDRVWIAEVRSVGTDSEMPVNFELQQNYPNPFNPTTTIVYALPDEAHVTLEVFNAMGQRVRVLVDQSQVAGTHRIEFEADGLPSGIYFYRLNAGSHASVRQMTLLK